MSKEQLYRSQGRLANYVWYMVQATPAGPKREAMIAQYEMAPAERSQLDALLAASDTKRAGKQTKEQQLKTLGPIQRAIAEPTWKNLIALRSGYDEFSKMSIESLRELTGAQPEIDGQLDDQDQAAAYRWVARGLPAPIALKKIRIGKQLAKQPFDKSEYLDYELADALQQIKDGE